MAKTFKITNTLYDVNADVVLNNGGNLEIAEFSGEGSETNNKRELAKTIRASYEDEGLTVQCVANITTAKRTEVRRFTVDATTEEIIAACKSAGITVTEE